MDWRNASGWGFALPQLNFFVLVGVGLATVLFIKRLCTKPRDPTWFSMLFGFHETYRAVQKNLVLENENMFRSKVNGREFPIGTFSTPSLKELRDAVKQIADKEEKNCGERRNSLLISHIAVRDVYATHQSPEYEGAMFQVASQFNCLEFVSGKVTPECGVTSYDCDLTQGPACCLACPSATLYRNYFVRTPKGNTGQTKNDQINNLCDLEILVDNETNRFWTTKNGYTNATSFSLEDFNVKYNNGEWNRDFLLESIRIGIHSNIEVIRSLQDQKYVHNVNQAFCSAISISYSDAYESDWENIAKLVLDAAYEATLLAAILNLSKGGSNIVILTFIGGGVFGNNWLWIINSLCRACAIASHFALDVRIAHYRRVDSETQKLIDSKYEALCKTFN